MLLQKILAVVEGRRIGEERHGDELAVHGLRLNHGGQVLADHVLHRAGQVHEIGGELGRPDDVGAIDVHILVAGRKPEPILAELVRRGGWHGDDGHLVARRLLERVELPAHLVHVAPDRAERDAQGFGVRAGTSQNRGGDEPCGECFQHMMSSRFVPISAAFRPVALPGDDAAAHGFRRFRSGPA